MLCMFLMKPLRGELGDAAWPETFALRAASICRALHFLLAFLPGGKLFLRIFRGDSIVFRGLAKCLPCLPATASSRSWTCSLTLPLNSFQWSWNQSQFIAVSFQSGDYVPQMVIVGIRTFCTLSHIPVGIRLVGPSKTSFDDPGRVNWSCVRKAAASRWSHGRVT